MKSFAVPEDHELVVKLQESFKEVTGEDLPIDYDPSVCDSNIRQFPAEFLLSRSDLPAEICTETMSTDIRIR